MNGHEIIEGHEIAAPPEITAMLTSLIVMVVYARAYAHDFRNGMSPRGNELASTRIAEAEAIIARAEGRLV